MTELAVIRPDWDAPAHIHAFCTSRAGGSSEGPYASLNLASHVDDRPVHVEANRLRLRQAMALPAEPCWLEQTHSTRVIDLDHDFGRDGDAGYTAQPGVVAVVLTADCLPLLLCDRQGNEVAAAHAGWRGLLEGVVENTVTAMRSPADELLAWLGPAIGPRHFEVGEEVLQAFSARTPGSESAFVATRAGHYLADLYAIARLRLNMLGITHIWGGEYCTFEEPQRFFSYRRERTSGRQASLIWIG